MSRRVEDKVALVTGAARGLGLATAKRLANEGARLVITDANVDAGMEAAAGLDAYFIGQDVTDEACWRAVMAEIEQRFGGLHIQVNNAGIEGGAETPKDVERGTLDEFRRVMDVNAAGVFLACKHGIKLLARSGGGSIINLSSIAALAPQPALVGYGASKAAVAHISRSVALYCAQAGYQIRCNAVHPGMIRTPMLENLIAMLARDAGVDHNAAAVELRAALPLGRFQTADDIANLVLFLASDESNQITGQSIAVDGGYTLTH